jgi:antitoxin CptB
VSKNPEFAESPSRSKERSREFSRLRWQCRRGMRELDELLLGYLNNRYDDAPDSDKQTFHAILELPDPELVSYLLQKEQPAAELKRVVTHILDRTRS